MGLQHSFARSVALTTILVFALGACSKGAQAVDDVVRGSGGATPTFTPAGSSGGIGSNGGGEASDGSGGSQDGGSADGGSQDGGSQDSGDGGESQQASNDDLKVFGYATADEGQLADEVTLVSGTVTQLATDAAARDLDATRTDAAILLDQARTLEADANSATQRQKPLEPADPTLAKARGDAIDAFGLTAEYAATVVDLAEAALDLNLTQLISVAQQATSLEGTSVDLEQAYEDLNRELSAWAQDHPAEAAEALARFAT
jgi:hypothetical protein